MARAATETQRAGLTGLEYGLAIPGTVGGAVWANAGAHGSDTASVLESATVLLADGTEAVRPVGELGFSYRHSRFKDANAGAISPAEIVLGAVFRLRAADPADIKARLDDIRTWRREHQPLGIPSAGSVFRIRRATPRGAWSTSSASRATVSAARSCPKARQLHRQRRARNRDHVRRLAEHVRDQVRVHHGIDLDFEIEFVGDWSPPAPEETA